MQENQKREIFFISRSAGIFFFLAGLLVVYTYHVFSGTNILAHIKSLVLPPTFDWRYLADKKKAKIAYLAEEVIK